MRAGLYLSAFQNVDIVLYFRLQGHHATAIRTGGAAGTIILTSGPMLGACAVAGGAKISEIHRGCEESVPRRPRVRWIAEGILQPGLKNLPGGRNKLRRTHRAAVAGDSRNWTRHHGLQGIQAKTASNIQKGLDIPGRLHQIWPGFAGGNIHSVSSLRPLRRGEIAFAYVGTKVAFLGKDGKNERRVNAGPRACFFSILIGRAERDLLGCAGQGE